MQEINNMFRIINFFKSSSDLVIDYFRSKLTTLFQDISLYYFQDQFLLLLHYYI